VSTSIENRVNSHRHYGGDSIITSTL
jgi:hypothetical protein